MARTLVARNVYRDAYGFDVRWRELGRTRSKRFPADTPIATLTAYRDTKERLARQDRARHAGGSFPRDAVRFLRGRRSLPSFKSDRAHLRPWIRRFRAQSRYTITREQVQRAIDTWRAAGYSPRELRHRRRILSQCLTTWNGPDWPNPCTGVTLPTIQKSRPRSVSDTLVRDVALQLRKQEVIGRLRDAKTRARFLVLATTGQRPAQLRRAQPTDVDLERRIWFVEPAKGDNGAIVYLNEDMYAAWLLFITARAWGDYDGRSFVKTLRRNGWPKGIRPYTLRHTVGLSLSELGVDLGDIQAHMGHASPTTTRIYVPAVLQRLREASQKLDGRLVSPFAVEAPLPRAPATSTGRRKGEGVDNPAHFETGSGQHKSRLRGSKTTKTA